MGMKDKVCKLENKSSCTLYLYVKGVLHSQKGKGKRKG